MKKIILLTTAAALLSPLAAKANNKSSIMVGLKGMWERQATGSSNTGGEDILKGYEGENFLAGGLEGYYTYKVWKNLQVAAGAEITFAPEHTFKDENKKLVDADKAPYAIGFAPRVNVGWAIAAGNDVEITPYIGFGVEGQFAERTKADGKKEWTSQWKMPILAGVRVNYSYFYANVAGRFDATSTNLMEGLTKEGKADARYAGVELSIGAEF
jgi:hypothetical protein